MSVIDTRDKDRAFAESILARAREEGWPAIESVIKARFDAPPAEGILAEMAHYHYETGGKRIRALIPSAVFGLYGLSPASYPEFPAAIEILHNATLIHDDLQDGDEIRRGKETVWKAYGAPQAINSGDAFFFYSMALLSKLDIDATLLPDIVTIFAASSLQVIRGQADEFVEKDQIERTTVDAYLRVVEGKTGGLLGLPLRGAGLIARGNLDYDQILEGVGNTLGTVFQIQDDLLDVIGEKGRGFKAADLAEGKPSFLAIHAIENGSTEQRSRLLSILKKAREETSPDDLKEGISILEDTGAIRAAFDSIEKLEAHVVSITEDIAEEELRSFLRGLTGFFLRPIHQVIESHD